MQITLVLFPPHSRNIKMALKQAFHCHCGGGRWNNNVHFQRFNYNHTIPITSMDNFNLNITALCRDGRLKEALHFLLTTHNPPPNLSAYLQLLRACISEKSLAEGKKIHCLISERKFKFPTHKILQDTFIRMYDKCGILVDARHVFDEMTERDTFSWNVIIAAYTRNGNPREAVILFQQMQQMGVQPDRFTFGSILPACGKIKALQLGINIHQSIIESGFLPDVVVTSALVDMYIKCGCIDRACELFDKISEKDAVSWTTMIAGYEQNGFVGKALETFKRMQSAGVKSDSATFACVLSACAKMGALEQGVDIHRSLIESGFLSDVVVASALLSMYAKCGSIEKAHKLFEKIPRRDMALWNAMIAGYAQNGVLDEALRLFGEMPRRNAISWTAVIVAYVQNEFVEDAIAIFKQMQSAGVKPDSTTFASILPACAKLKALEQGMNIHQNIIKSGFLSDDVVGSSLVEMYAKCGSMHKAHMLFERMPKREVISWTSMIAGYAQNGFVEKALENFKQMQLAGVLPNSTTFSSILPACAKMGALEQGMNIHQRMVESGFWSDVVAASALVDMYAKCGCIRKARKLFDKMPKKNSISWNAMIAGYALNGFCNDALEQFELMKQSGALPDHVSFTCILLACSHAGLVDEGCKYFNGIEASHSIMPTVDHYVCMIDLFGRAGYLEEALNFIIKIPIKPVMVVWLCLLSACRGHKDTELGLFIVNLLFELDNTNASTYVLLSNIYAEVGRWDEAQMVRRLMKARGIKKIPGCSWIEDHKMLHAFCADKSYPPTYENYGRQDK